MQPLVSYFGFYYQHICKQTRTNWPETANYRTHIASHVHFVQCSIYRRIQQSSQRWSSSWLFALFLSLSSFHFCSSHKLYGQSILYHVLNIIACLLVTMMRMNDDYMHVNSCKYLLTEHIYTHTLNLTFRSACF